MRLPPSHVRAGRYRTRTATTTTAASGRNREELLGPRSDFSRPRQGVAEKSANATRKAVSARCRFLGPLGMSTKKDAAAGAPFQPTPVRASNPNNNDQRQGIIMAMVSCLWCYISLFFHGRVWYTRLSSTNRNLSGRGSSILLRKTVLSLKSPTGAFIAALRFANANLSGRGPSILLPQDRSVA